MVGFASLSPLLRNWYRSCLANTLLSWMKGAGYTQFCHPLQSNLAKEYCTLLPLSTIEFCHPITQASISLAHNGTELPAFAGADFLKHIDLGSARSTVHRARHGRDCPSFSKLAQKSAAKWTPQRTPKPQFYGPMVDTTTVSH